MPSRGKWAEGREGRGKGLRRQRVPGEGEASPSLTKEVNSASQISGTIRGSTSSGTTNLIPAVGLGTGASLTPF